MGTAGNEGTGGVGETAEGQKVTTGKYQKLIWTGWRDLN